MLTLHLPEKEFFNEQTSEIFTMKAKTLVLEHSLVSLSKWEQRWQKPFLAKGDKTRDETLSYIKCMTITQKVDPNIFTMYEEELREAVMEYIEKPMTATIINENDSKINNDIITSEIIYFWMIQFNIPFECQKWNLNRLLTLIRVCSLKLQKGKRMSRSEIVKRNRDLNSQRRKKLGTKG